MRAARLAGGSLELGRAPLGQPHNPRVIAEIGIAQLGMAVESQPRPHGALEAASEKVGEEVGARLGGGRLGHLLLSEHVVAVVAAQPADAALGQHPVERAVGAAVGVGDRHLPVAT